MIIAFCDIFFDFFAFSVDHFFLIFRVSITGKLHLNLVKHNFWWFSIMISGRTHEVRAVQNFSNISTHEVRFRPKKKTCAFENITCLNCTGTVPTSFSRPGPCPVLAGPCPVFAGPCRQTGPLDMGCTGLILYIHEYSSVFKYCTLHPVYRFIF